MQANKKDSIATWSAVGMLGFGVCLTTAGFIIPPVGQVHDSVLWILGQVLIYVGSIFGLTVYTRHKLDEIERKIGSKPDNENDKENE